MKKITLQIIVAFTLLLSCTNYTNEPNQKITGDMCFGFELGNTKELFYSHLDSLTHEKIVFGNNNVKFEIFNIEYNYTIMPEFFNDSLYSITLFPDIYSAPTVDFIKSYFVKKYGIPNSGNSKLLTWKNTKYTCHLVILNKEVSTISFSDNELAFKKINFEIEKK